MLTVAVYNITYDTVAYDFDQDCDIDMRATIPADHLPKGSWIKIDSADFADFADRDPAELGTTIQKALEKDWCVDGFDYQIVRPIKLRPYRHDCKVRADGEPTGTAKMMAVVKAKRAAQACGLKS